MESGNKERLLKVLDEDGMIERWYLDGNGKAYTTLNNGNMQNTTSLKNALEKITALNGISDEVKPNLQANPNHASEPLRALLKLEFK